MNGAEKTLGVFISVFLFLVIFSCGQTPEDARRELGKMNIAFSDQSFIQCVERKDILAVKLFLAAGKNSSTAWEGKIALLIAIDSGNEEIVNLLLKKDDPSPFFPVARDKGAARAAYNGYTNMLIALLNKGANINALSNKGDTLLILAANNGRTDTVEFLKGKGLDINATDKDGESALMKAAFNCQILTVKYLIDNKALINHRSKFGQTALMGACMKNCAPVVNLLVDNGADINAVSTRGETAMSIARRNDNEYIVNILTKRTR